ncbi:CGNR zinc finger domain-containing protein [Longispora sp. K20-0274]|uniref:CGNR zinc finger domain-containing protein n=1 Tax=Longispora sp. K20-0274 TaxID=3088255 RepID=UPI00399B5AB8
MINTVELAVQLVNHLATARVRGRTVEPPTAAAEVHAAVLAARDEAGLDEETALTEGDTGPLAGFSVELGRALDACANQDVTGAADLLNELMARYSAVPNLHGFPGQPPTLAYHRPGVGLLAAWRADLPAGVATLVGLGQTHRFGRCTAEGCDLVFFDRTRNASRRFCGVGCQNRAKAAAYRARRA